MPTNLGSPAFCAGLDVGRKRDRSVLTFLHDTELSHIVKYERISFEEQADAISYAASVNKARIFVDNTGMGVAMVDLLTSRGARVTPVDITAGRLTIRQSGSVAIGHQELFEHVGRFIRWPNFTIKHGCPHITDLRDELKQLVGSYTGSGKLHVEARQGHDDFAFSFALAVLNFLLGKGYGDGAEAQR